MVWTEGKKIVNGREVWGGGWNGHRPGGLCHGCDSFGPLIPFYPAYRIVGMQPRAIVDAKSVEAHLRMQIQEAWRQLEAAAAGPRTKDGSEDYTRALERYCRLLYDSSLYLLEGKLPVVERDDNANERL
jgi:hypothetical protein